MSLILTGCKGSVNDINEELNKINNVIEDDDIFDQDYSMKVKIKMPSQNNHDSFIEYVVKVDGGDKYYLDFNAVHQDENSSTKIWVEEVDDRYYLYIDKGVSKIYHEYTNKDDAFKEFDDLGVTINSSLKDTYTSLYKELIEMVKKCKNKNDTTCSIEKTLLGKVTLNVIEESLVGAIVESSYILKRGKILEVNISSLYEEESNSVVIKFSYGNQRVLIPKKSEYIG